MNGYITVEQAAKKWGVTDRQVQIWCKDKRIDGATKLSRIWIIPETAKKPTADKKISHIPNKVLVWTPCLCRSGRRRACRCSGADWYNEKGYAGKGVLGRVMLNPLQIEPRKSDIIEPTNDRRIFSWL